MEILQIVSALALVFGLLAALYWFSNKYSGKLGGGPNRKIKIIEKQPLGDKRSLLLVEIGQQSFLLGSTTNNISMLTPVDASEKGDKSEASEETESKDKTVSFKRVLEMIR